MLDRVDSFTAAVSLLRLASSSSSRSSSCSIWYSHFSDERPNPQATQFRDQQLQVFDFRIAQSKLLALKKDFLLLCGELFPMREDLLISARMSAFNASESS